MTRSSYKKLILLLSILIPCVIISAPATAQSPQSWPKTISITGGSPGGGMHAVATGMAALLNKYLKVKTVAESGLFGKISLC